ncbi:SDR family oxidoreductase [Sphingomonas sanguinis]|uniref:SDR family NAD(P)-dependent oxidoreductase n=1 Tax=Sphingomonas sanguinis TaxID=33051 RepID=UPI001C594261|nr:SDR family oxidoreductase [Sphingomonas sanguinis]QXT36376.1 SDR family oxidoreductase [Sphingomonas sanguinis]
MDLGIKGRIALISGADSGMGKETARLLLEAGVRVALTDKPDGTLEEAVEELSPLGEVIAVTGDVTQAEAVRAIWAEVRERLGDPDIYVNAAGVTGATGDFLEIDDKGWQETIDIDLMGAVRMCREAIPGMRSKGWGRIVLFASEDAVQPYIDELPYCAAKAGILSLAKGLSKAYGPDNVLVNTVSPAFIATPMTDKMMEKRAEEKGVSFDEAIETFLDEERPGMALKRRGRPEEVAAAVAFLVSERASFINGAGIRVDSGSVFTIAG